MNTRQTKILESWHQVLWDFTKREWFSLFLWSGLGVLAAESVDLLLRDHSFQRYLLSNYKPNVSFDDPKHYAPYVAIVLVTMFLAVIAYISAYVRRGLKSWRAGVTSGLVLLPFVSAFFISMLPSSRFHHRLILGGSVVGLWFLLGFVLYLMAKIRSEQIVREDEFKVPSSIKSLAGSQVSESDDPIQSWPQREPQSLTVHLRHAAHRIHRASWMIDSGATALHCGRVLALTRGNTGKIRKLFFSDSMALEDKATVLRRNLSPTDRQQAIRTETFGAEIEKLGEMARRLRAKLENCYVKIKRYTVSVTAEEKKNPEFRKRTRRPRGVRPRRAESSNSAFLECLPLCAGPSKAS